VVVDDVVPVPMLEEFRDVEAFPHFGYEFVVFFIPPRANGV
jgi:hypothetical protein